MKMFARFDENPAMTLQDIKKTKRYGWTDARTHTRTHGQRENSIPTTNKVCGGYNELYLETNKPWDLQQVAVSDNQILLLVRERLLPSSDCIHPTIQAKILMVLINTVKPALSNHSKKD